MDVTEAIAHRLEVRSFADRTVAPETKRAVLDAGRLAPSGKNRQHWRFVLVDGAADLSRLASLSTTGTWVRDAAFAVAVCTDPDLDYHALDAGRAITHMQFAAWDRGVGSCIYTVFDEGGTRSFLGVPDSHEVTAVVGFGYPEESGRGRKNRRPLSEVASRGRFDAPLDLPDEA